MKKRWIGIAALALTVALTACGAPAPTEPDDPEIWDNSILEDLYNTQGQVNGTDYSYRLPGLPETGAAAAAINESIAAAEGEAVRQAQADIEAGRVPEVLSVDWSGSWGGSTLSLVLETRTETGRSYSVYNYDAGLQVRPTNRELIRRAGFTEPEFTDALRRAVLDWYARTSDRVLGEGTGLLTDLRADAISAERMELEDQRICLDEDGRMAVICNLTDETGSMDVFLYPERVTEREPMTAGLDFIQASLDGNQVSLRFSENETSEALLPQNISFDVDYPVDGLYGEYTGLWLFNQGQDFTPTLFLVDTQGGVSFCDVMMGVRSGGVFTAAGPLSLPEAAVRLEGKGTEGSGDMVYAYSEKGTKMDVTGAVVDAALTTSRLVHGSLWENSQDETALEMDAGGEGLVRWVRPDAREWVGAYNFAGMTEDGLRFFLELWTHNDQTVEGTLYVDLSSSEAPAARMKLNNGQTYEFSRYTPEEQPEGN